MLDVGDNLAHPNDGNDMVEPPRTEAEPVPKSSKNVESEVEFEDEEPDDIDYNDYPYGRPLEWSCVTDVNSRSGP